METTINKTGFELVDYLPQHALQILAGDVTEPGLVLDDQAVQFAHDAAGNGPCTTGMFDGKPVSCGGFETIRRGFAEIWMINVSDIGRYHIDPRAAKQWIYDEIARLKFWRVQTPLRTGYRAGELYVKWLGFRFEARLECYHVDGSDALMYTIITREYLKGV
jgi:hypothetical protein